MRPGRGPLLAVLAVLAAAPGVAGAVDLAGAQALARAHEPSLRRAQAQVDAAGARADQARAGRMPNISAAVQAGEGESDFGGFFGFGSSSMSPRAARLIFTQPLYAGGGITAAIDQATAGRRAADRMLIKARLDLEATVADAYGAVLVTFQAERLAASQVEVATELARHATLRFEAGEIPRSDYAQIQARAADARAGQAQARAELERARARYRALTGEEPVDLTPLGPPPAIPATLEAARAAALTGSPSIAAAEAGSDAADAAVRRARAGYLPELSLVAEGSSLRDQFFPGYRADGYTVGLQGRWTLFSGGAQGARVGEAEAGGRVARADAMEAREAVIEAVTALWYAIEAADMSFKAATAQADSAVEAESSLEHEVRVDARPMVDLLDAQKESISALTAAMRAGAARVVLRYRLRSLLGESWETAGGRAG